MSPLSMHVNMLPAGQCLGPFVNRWPLRDPQPLLGKSYALHDMLPGSGRPTARNAVFAHATGHASDESRIILIR